MKLEPRFVYLSSSVFCLGFVGWLFALSPVNLASAEVGSKTRLEHFLPFERRVEIPVHITIPPLKVGQQIPRVTITITGDENAQTLNFVGMSFDPADVEFAGRWVTYTDRGKMEITYTMPESLPGLDPTVENEVTITTMIQVGRKDRWLSWLTGRGATDAKFKVGAKATILNFSDGSFVSELEAEDIDLDFAFLGKPEITLAKVQHKDRNGDGFEDMQDYTADEPIFPADKLVYDVTWTNDLSFDLDVSRFVLKTDFSTGTEKHFTIVATEHNADLSQQEQGIIMWSLPDVTDRERIEPNETFTTRVILALDNAVPLKAEDESSISQVTATLEVHETVEGVGVERASPLETALWGEVKGRIVGPYEKPVIFALVNLLREKKREEQDFSPLEPYEPIPSSPAATAEGEAYDHFLATQLTDEDGAYSLFFKRAVDLRETDAVQQLYLQLTYLNKSDTHAYKITDGVNQDENILHFISQPIDIAPAAVTVWEYQMADTNVQDWIYPTEPEAVELATAAAEAYTTLVAAKKYINEIDDLPKVELNEYSVLRLLPKTIDAHAANSPDLGIYMGKKYWSVLDDSDGIRMSGTLLHEFGHSIFREIVYAGDVARYFQYPDIARGYVDAVKLPNRFLRWYHVGFVEDTTTGNFNEAFSSFFEIFFMRHRFPDQYAKQHPLDRWFETGTTTAIDGLPWPAVGPYLKLTSDLSPKDVTRTNHMEELAFEQFFVSLVNGTPRVTNQSEIQHINWADPEAGKVTLIYIPEGPTTTELRFKQILSLLASFRNDEEPISVTHFINALRGREFEPRSDLEPIDQAALYSGIFSDETGANFLYDASSPDEEVGRPANETPFYAAQATLYGTGNLQVYEQPVNHRGSASIRADRRGDDVEVEGSNASNAPLMPFVVGSRPWRQLPPPTYPNSYLKITIENASPAGEYVNLDVRHTPAFAHFDYVIRKPVSNGQVYFQLPDELYHTKLIASVDGSSTHPFVIDSRDYWAALDSETDYLVDIAFVKDGGSPPEPVIDFSRDPTPSRPDTMPIIRPVGGRRIVNQKPIPVVEEIREIDQFQVGDVVVFAVGGLAAPGFVTIAVDGVVTDSQTILAPDAAVSVRLPDTLRSGEYEITVTDELQRTASTIIRATSTARLPVVRYLIVILLAGTGIAVYFFRRGRIGGVA